MASEPRASGRSANQSFTTFEIVQSVNNFIEQKFAHLPKGRRLELVKEATGIKSNSAVSKYIKGPKKGTQFARGQPSKIKDYDHDTIRKVVYKLYEDGKAPNSQMIFDQFVIEKKDEDPDWQPMSHRTFRTALKKLGFKYLNLISNRKIVMDRPDLVEWRGKYLTQIQTYREEGYVEVSTDETWFLTSDNRTLSWRDMSGKCEVSTKTTGHGKRFIIISAGTRDGFIPNATKVFGSGDKRSDDYHDDMNAALYEEWFANDLLPNLPQKSVVILDNAPYHNRLSTKKPRFYWTKAKIRECLADNGIVLTDSEFNKKGMTKAKLIALGKNIEDQYAIDKIIKDFQIDHPEKIVRIIRLPPYHCIFQAIEEIWAFLKIVLRRKNASCETVEIVRKIIDEGFEQIATSSLNHWVKAFENVLKAEQTYETIDEQNYNDYDISDFVELTDSENDESDLE